MLNLSFFSYKGGSGRTSLLYNTLPFIAMELKATPEEPLIVLDFDIDSKGLSFLLKGPNNTSSDINTIQVLSRSGIFDGVNDKERFFSMMLPVGELVGLSEEMDRSILFISANPTNDENRYINGSNNFDSGDVDLSYFVDLCMKCHCKAMIMDNPAGNQLAADAALSISNKIVTVMRVTSQFREGTAEFLMDKSSRFCGKEFIIVPNAVPADGGTDFPINNIMDRIKRRLKDVIEVDNGRNDFNFNMIDHDTNGVNEIRLFKFQETNLNKKVNTTSLKLADDEQLAIKKFKLLANELTKKDQ